MVMSIFRSTSSAQSTIMDEYRTSKYMIMQKKKHTSLYDNIPFIFESFLDPEGSTQQANSQTKYAIS